MSTKIYSYGAHEPTDGFESVRAQMRLAHRYRNVLVSLERKKRARVARALRRVEPALAPVDAGVARLEAEVEAATQAIRVVHARERRRVQVPAGAERLKALRAELRKLREEEKRLKKAAYKTEAWEAEQEKVDAWLYPRKKRLYAAVGACGLYWGTILQVDDSMKSAHKGAPPRFRRWDGRSKLAVQIQRGMSVPELLGGEDTRLRVARGAVTSEARPHLGLVRNGPRKGLPRIDHPSHRARTLGDATCLLRIGSEGRSPIFARIPFTMHRPLPPAARVKWAFLMVERVGSHERWRLQLVLADVPAAEDRATGGSVGVDVGWRMLGQERREVSTDRDFLLETTLPREGLEERRLRVASWAGSDGARGEVSLSAAWLGGMRKVEDIRSIRDKNFDAARVALSAWLATPASGLGSEDQSKQSGLLRETCASLASWKAPARLAALALRWRDARFPGDRDAFAALEEWRKRDRHLLDYEANLRERLQDARQDLYRKFAAKMRRTYGAIYVEKLDLRKFHEDPDVTEETPDGALREHARDACLSTLLGVLKESGAVEVPSGWTTRDCALCGHENEWEDQSPLVLTCGGCGGSWDQDENAARNILASGSAVKAPA